SQPHARDRVDSAGRSRQADAAAASIKNPMQLPPTRRLGITAICISGLLLTGCAAIPIKNMVMGGNADGVAIQFAGNVGATLPLAEKHCAQYERVPQLRDTNDDIVTYACIRR